jgi:hypothetical protein
MSTFDGGMKMLADRSPRFFYRVGHGGASKHQFCNAWFAQQIVVHETPARF